MNDDAFADRLARVRRRFVSTLEGRIEDAAAWLPKLSNEAPASATAVGEAYRCVHGIVGVGPTVGFPTTGRVAREVEDVLRPAQSDRRGLSDEEISVLRERLADLREAATQEMQAFYRGMKVMQE
jgi:chemotaxis protein histidine kinase CheA